MIATERQLNSFQYFPCFSHKKSTKRKTIAHLLENAVKERRTHSPEITDGNIRNNIIIKVSFNEVSQKFKLDESQDIALKIIF